MGYIKKIGAPDPPHQFDKPLPPSALAPNVEPTKTVTRTSADVDAATKKK